MSFQFVGKNRFYVGAQAHLIPDEREVADSWAAQHITVNPLYSWVLGRFVEADKANNNNQFFALDTLQASKPSVIHAPMNINHAANQIVGSFVASELVYPTGEGADDENGNAYMENLGVFWKYYFPEEYYVVKSANDAGNLFYSMECVPRAISSIGGSDDSQLYAYEGRTSPNYPPELNERSVPMKLHDPYFVGGALIVPPKRPGWSKAKVSQVAGFMNDCWKEAEMAYEQIADENPDKSPSEWEDLMAELIAMDAENEIARTFSQEQRNAAAKSGHAMPDGSFPIDNTGDLKNAIRAIGRAKDPAAAKSHIKKRAEALGATNLIPAGW